VSDPEAFAHDPDAQKSLKEAIAQEVGISVDAVIITDESVEPEAPAVLLQSHGNKARRREAPSGRVSIKYEIVPQVSGKSIDEVMDTLEHLTPEEVADVHQKTLLRNNGTKYGVKVDDTKTVVVSKSTGNTVRKADPLHGGAHQSVPGSVVVLLVLSSCRHLWRC